MSHAGQSADLVTHAREAPTTASPSVGCGGWIGSFFLRDGEMVETEDGTYVMRRGYLMWERINSRFSLRRVGFVLLRQLFDGGRGQPWSLHIPRDLVGKYVRPHAALPATQ